MNRSLTAAKKIGAICAAAVLVLFAVLRHDAVEDSVNKAAGSDKIDRNTRSHDRRKQVDKAKADLVARVKADRVKALEGFKSRWLSIGPDDVGRQELADECIKVLLLHPEMVELLLFLKQNNIGNEVWQAFDNFDQGELATSLRSSLIATASLDTGDRDQQSNLIISALCYRMGRCCHDEEFQQFFAALEQVSAWNAQQSLFGFCEKLVITRPKDALQSVLTQVSKRVDSQDTALQARMLFKSISPKLWKTSDFVDMESMLNQAFPDKSNSVPGSDRTVDELRCDLFKLWGERDIKAATAAALNYPDSVVFDLLGEIGLKVNQTSLVDWVVGLPNERYRNAAASGVLKNVHLLPPEIARELVAHLSDPALKAKKLEAISHLEQNGTGDPH